MTGHLLWWHFTFRTLIRLTWHLLHCLLYAQPKCFFYPMFLIKGIIFPVFDFLFWLLWIVLHILSHRFLKWLAVYMFIIYYFNDKLP